MFQFGVFSNSYFPVFNPNAGKYGPEKTSNTYNFHPESMIGPFHEKSEPFSAWCPLKGHTYLNKPAAVSS